MTRQEIIFRCMSFTDYYHVEDKGLTGTIKHILGECGFLYGGSMTIPARIVRFIFPALSNFDDCCRDYKYKMAAFKAIYFNSVSKGLTEDLFKDLKEYDKFMVCPKGDVGDFW